MGNNAGVTWQLSRTSFLAQYKQSSGGACNECPGCSGSWTKLAHSPGGHGHVMIVS